MVRTFWLLRPVTIFIFSLVATGVSFYIYLRSYFKVNDAFTKFILKHNFEESQILQSETWITTFILSILLVLILTGIMVIFIYYQRLIQLYRMQQNFINGFTHELKTPIASLKLYLDTFKKYELSRDDELKYLDYMNKDMQRLDNNVNQILNLAKIEDKKYRLSLAKVPLFEFLTSLTQKATHNFEKLKISIDNRLVSLEVSVNIDKTLFEMVFMNLVSNADRYNYNENKEVKIALESSGKSVRIIFEDNGLGMEKSEIKRIFKKFYQIGKSAKGSGIGLYLASQIMKLHKGNLSAMSEGKDRGSQFIVELPQVDT